MKFRALVGILAVGVAWSSAADSVYTFDFTSGFANGGVVPDGNATGWSDTQTITGIPSPDEISDVNVRLNLSGGYNGDLYGYLVHSSGFAVLLNRIGRTGTDAFGNSGSGMNVTLDDSASVNIHAATYGLLSGPYRPDGRTTDPATVTDGDTPSAFLSSFEGIGTSANGEWTLFLADLSVGEEHTVISWGLDITVIPEPSTWALFGLGLLGGVGLMRSRRLRR